MDRHQTHYERLQETSVQSLSKAGPQRTLSVVDFGYVYDSERLEQFERKHNAVVEVETVASSASAIDRLNSDPPPDVVALGNYAVPQAIAQELIKPMDVTQIEGYDAVFDQLKREYFEQGTSVYAVPRSFGQTVLCYRTDCIDSSVKSWDALWSGSFDTTMLRDDAQVALLYATTDSNLPVTNVSDDIAEHRLQNVFEDMLQPVDHLWQTVNDSQALFRRLAPVEIGPMWQFAARTLREKGEPIKIARPTAGMKRWFIQFVRPAQSDADSLAQTFIEAWYDSLGWDTLMQPHGIAIPSQQVFEKYEINPESYGLDGSRDLLEQPPLSLETVERCRKAWDQAKRTTGLHSE